MQRISTATKAVDLYGAGKHGFKNGDLAQAIAATDLNAEWFNGAQEELLALIEAAGLAPSDAKLNQVAMALQTGKLWTAAAAGTANAITATFTPAIAALVDGMALYVRASAANTTTTPTFTPASGTIVAKTIVKGAGAALAAGDIAGAGHWVELQYDQTLDKWVLLNPATGVTAGGAQYKGIQPVTSSVAANALTVGLNPTTLDFRSSALTNGVPNTRTNAAALSLVVPSGATLGTVSGQQARLVLIAIDNAGTMELAIVNLAGGNNLDETTLISTTAISAAATSAGVIYSTTARASVPFRVVGYLDITEAAAGTWATDATTKQGMGGQALQHLAAILNSAAVTLTGAAVDLTGIPFWAKRVTVVVKRGQNGGVANALIQGGTSSGIESTGYAGSTSLVGAGASTANVTTGIPLENTTSAARLRTGVCVFYKAEQTTNTWIYTGNFATEDAPYTVSSVGSKSFAGQFDRIRLLAGPGDSWTGGTAIVFWE